MSISSLRLDIVLTWSGYGWPQRFAYSPHATMFLIIFSRTKTACLDILRELLDPKGPHGQGDTFFASVNRDATRPILPRGSCSVFRENVTSESKGICAGLIFSWISRISAWRFENKPWTYDQTDQISHYVPLGTPIRGKKFRVTKEEEDGSDPLQQQTVGEFILENEGNLGIAVEVARAFPAIQRQIVQRAMDALEKQLRSRLGEKWDVWNDRDKVLLKNIAWVGFCREAWGEGTSRSKFADRRKIRFLAFGVTRNVRKWLRTRSSRFVGALPHHAWPRIWDIDCQAIFRTAMLPDNSDKRETPSSPYSGAYVKRR